MICQHYGYKDFEAIQTGHHGYWPKESFIERVGLIPDFLRLSGLEKRKFRIILDFDPEFPRAMIHVESETIADHSDRKEQPSGGTPEEPKSSERSQ